LDACDPFAVLSIVNVSLLLPPRETDDGLKLFVKPGRSVATVKLALAVPLFPALDVRSPETFMYVPAEPPTTSTVSEHDAEAATEPSLKAIVPPPLGAVSVPPQVVEAFAGAAIVTPAGKMSVNAKSATGDPTSLAISNRSVETPPGPIVPGTKAFEKLG
jgi:hypothetical protein